MLQIAIVSARQIPVLFIPIIRCARQDGHPSAHSRRGGLGLNHAARAQVDYNMTDKYVYDGVFAACIEKKVSYG
ncbi:hypothetical protein KQS06HV_50478 [Klebsiella quasipneumoniae subsp. similipneumoniae]|nr:hypothetical protein KQS06HV_50478 [Klebsiella quasipneumoniae subsp. similipneumoniae]